MSIAPIQKSVFVKVAADRAFTAFIRDIGRWWPRGVGQKPLVNVVVEPRVGGRWYEEDAEGQVTQWGEVLAWEPPRRVLLAWQLDATWKYDREFVTEVEVLFEPTDGGTRVMLEHRDLERFGASAREHAARLLGGWGSMVDRYADYAATADRFTVHGVAGSPYVRAVLLAFEEKGEHGWHLAALRPGDQRGAEHLQRHPFARVPAFEHGDFKLYETQAIVRYLDRVLPGPALVPADPRAEARMNQVIGIVDCYLMSQVSSAIVFPRVIAPALGLPVDAGRVEAALPAARTCVAALAGLLGERPFFAGRELSLADLMVAPHLSFLPLFADGQALLAPHPALAAWIARMEARPSMVATTWSRLTERVQAA